MAAPEVPGLNFTRIVALSAMGLGVAEVIGEGLALVDASGVAVALGAAEVIAEGLALGEVEGLAVGVGVAVGLGVAEVIGEGLGSGDGNGLAEGDPLAGAAETDGLGDAVSLGEGDGLAKVAALGEGDGGAARAICWCPGTALAGLLEKLMRAIRTVRARRRSVRVGPVLAPPTAS
jgi:hypothetical protein